MRYRVTGLRRAGWALAILGAGSTIALNVARALLARGDASEFNWDVGWANILSAMTGAAGLIMVMAERLAARSDLSPARMAALADDLAREAMPRTGNCAPRCSAPMCRIAGPPGRTSSSGSPGRPLPVKPVETSGGLIYPCGLL